MLKITTMAKDEDTMTFLLEGRIVGEWIHEVDRTCEKGLGERKKVILNLSCVTFANDEGIKVLKALRGSGVRLEACSPFLLALLEDPC